MVFSAEEINSVAFSKNSEFLQGKPLSNFIQLSSSTTRFVIDQLTSGVSGLYIKAADLATALSDYYLKSETDTLLDLKLTKTSNLSDLTNVTTARSNLGLGTLATQSTVSNAIPSCNAAQTLNFTVPTGYQCISIAIANTQVSGLGTLSTKSSVLDADIISMSGLKLTGPLLIGTTATCDTSGVTRYTSGSLEICNGSAWVKIKLNDRDVYAAYVRNTAQELTTAGTKFIWTTAQETSHPSAMNTTTGDFTCPISGVYKIQAQVGINSNGSLNTSVLVNAVECTVGREASSGITTNLVANVSCIERCESGQVIFIRATPSANTNSLTTANMNYVQILKVAD